MTMEEKCRDALRQLIDMCIEGGMDTFQIADVIEPELAKLRRPYQDPKDN